MKQKTCKHCKEKFTPERSFQSTCGLDCAVNLARKKAADKIKKNRNRAKKAFNQSDRTYLTKMAQKAFNAYIRLRDGNTCISCGATNRQIHAGHFRPVGRNAKLRFNEFNCHSQCSICNNHLSGNLVLYRDAMIAKYGEQKVLELESDNEPYKYSVEELQEIIEKYKKKYKELQDVKNEKII